MNDQVGTRRIAFLCAGIALAIAGCVRGIESAGPAQAQWDRQNIEALIAAVEDLAAEGLSPVRYDAELLKAVLDEKKVVKAEAVASGVFAKVAVDLTEGVISPARRAHWSIEGPVADFESISSAMETALQEHRIQETIAAFAPDHTQYALLKAALAETETADLERIARLRLNMERWRWMPRRLGADYIMVNVPSFDIVVVKDGAVADHRRIIAGAPKTPTPQFAAAVTGVTFNPTWHVPASIVAESVGAILESDPEAARNQGYYVTADGGVRQMPGSGNALGRVKLEMPNPFSVFLHDTPAKALFQREARAFSHGCIRVEDALRLAQILLEPEWDQEKINEVVSTGTTVTVKLERPLPIYITYFTAIADMDGAITYYPDTYGRDRPLLPDFDGRQAAVSTTPQETVIAQEGCPAPTHG